MTGAVISKTSITAGLLLLALSAAAQDKAAADRARSLFSSQKCTMCHSIEGKGNPKGALDDVGSKLKAEEIRQWLVDPEGMRLKTKAIRTPSMKPPKLAKDQVDTLVAYLQSLRAPAAASPAR